MPSIMASAVTCRLVLTRRTRGEGMGPRRGRTTLPVLLVLPALVVDGQDAPEDLLLHLQLLVVPLPSALARTGIALEPALLLRTLLIATFPDDCCSSRRCSPLVLENLDPPDPAIFSRLAATGGQPGAGRPREANWTSCAAMTMPVGRQRLSQLPSFPSSHFAVGLATAEVPLRFYQMRHISLA